MLCRPTVTFFSVISGLVFVAALSQGCKRVSEEPTPETPVEAEEEQRSLTVMDLPQFNPQVGITVNAVPIGLAATYNEENWIKLTDETRPRLTYVLVASGEYLMGVAAASIDEFEGNLARQSEGELTGSGDIETSLGTARWSSGVFSEDGEMVDQLVLFAPHPNREGQIIVSATCPPGLSSSGERLDVILEVLKQIS